VNFIVFLVLPLALYGGGVRYFSLFEYWPFAMQRFADVPFPPHIKGHSTSPMVWLERGSDNAVEPLGGDDRFREWLRAHHAPLLSASAEVRELVESSPFSKGFYHLDGPKPTVQ
jgi:hypothetical protein